MARTPSSNLTALLKHALEYDGDECLLWPYAATSGGYGQIFFDGKYQRVHRVVCVKAHGDAPPLKPLALHSCGRGHDGCIAKRHLRWGSVRDNAQDAKSHGVLARGLSNGAGKFSDGEICAIVEASKNMPRREISQQFHISYSYLNAILRGEKRVDS